MSRKRQVVAVLHNIRSLHNVGSIFRTADGAGITKLYLSGITPVPTNRFGHTRPQLSKVALGAEKTIPWEKARDTIALLKRLKKDGFKIFALEQHKNSTSLFSLKTKSYPADAGLKVCIVVGNEVRGLTPAILQCADEILEIPMRGKKESLNVSVAFGIAAYALL